MQSCYEPDKQKEKTKTVDCVTRSLQITQRQQHFPILYVGRART